VDTLLLHLDDALLLQPTFVDAALSVSAHEVDERRCGSAVRLWSRRESLDLLKPSIARPVGAHASPRLCFLGSGDFHHVSALLIAEAAENFDGPLTVIHIDNHPDWVNFDKGIHCGSWVNEVAKHRNVQKIITLGVCSGDLQSPERKGANLDNLTNGKVELYPYDHLPSRVKHDYSESASYTQSDGHLIWSTMKKMGLTAFTEHLLSRIFTSNVYITIDKDCLSLDDAITNWDQGRLRLSTILELLSDIAIRHRIVGADVIGDYSSPTYSGTLLTRLLKQGEILIDQPLRAPDAVMTCDRNTLTNLTLLRSFSEILA
jgi:arginase family enzyme